ncbi:alpha-ribazole phosphatase [Clostridiaceae bacterium 14S0207]|nr:alpha-ribazole phosphatase [Clostridiaceae bacterium 14S0207]
MNIYIVRHGYTDENHKGTYYGALDPGINKNGKKQCELIRKEIENINFDKIYISSKKRAKETANLIVSKKIEFYTDKRLDERNFGVFEGKEYKYLMENYSKEYKEWEEDWINYKIPNGESHKDFSLRIYEFLDEILQIYKENDNILLVTHAGVIRVIYTYVMNKDIALFWKFASHNGDLSLIKYEYGNIFIDFIKHNKE